MKMLLAQSVKSVGDRYDVAHGERQPVGGGSGGGAIGEYDFHSPVGDMPWIVFLIFAVVYVARKRKEENFQH